LRAFGAGRTSTALPARFEVRLLAAFISAKSMRATRDGKPIILIRTDFNLAQQRHGVRQAVRDSAGDEAERDFAEDMARSETARGILMGVL